MKKSLPDLIISIFLLVFLASLAFQIPEIPEVSRGYPLFLLVVSTGMTLYLFITSLMKMSKEVKIPTEAVRQAKTIVPYCVMILVYIFLMGKIGYIASTVLFMVVSFIYLKLPNKILAVVYSIIVALILYYVFTTFLTVILPRGTWFNIGF